MVKLIGVVIVFLGFAFKMEPIGTIIIAAIVTGFVGGLNINEIFTLLGKTFVQNRYMCLFVIILPVIGVLERNGIKVLATRFMRRVKGPTPGKIIVIYGLIRTAISAFNISLGGVAGFVRPVICPLAIGALEAKGFRVKEKDKDIIKGLAAAQENFSWFFGQLLFVAGPGVLLVKATLDSMGYYINPVKAVKSAIPVVILSVIISAVYILYKDRLIMKRYNKTISDCTEVK